MNGTIAIYHSDGDQLLPHNISTPVSHLFIYHSHHKEDSLSTFNLSALSGNVLENVKFKSTES